MDIRQELTASRIVLLDLNFTLVQNSPQKWGVVSRCGYTAWVRDHETYREDLIDLLKGHTVVLITARPCRWEDLTLARIFSETGWKPDLSLFNPDREILPPECKRRALVSEVYPRFGLPEATPYLALESNCKTRAMYAEQGIPAAKVGEFV